MSNINKWLIITSMLFLAGCTMPWDSKEDEQQNAAANQIPPAEVNVIVAQKEDIPILFTYPARIVSEQSVDVVAKVSGTLLEQYFKPGDSVKKDDKLFLIDPEKYETAQEISSANLEVSNANFQRAKLNYNRALRLKKTNSISSMEFDNASSEYKTAEANIKSAEAALRNANIDLNYTIVKAPFDGVLGDTNQDEGTFITSANANLVRLTKLDPIYAKFAISDVDMLNINDKTANKEWVQNNAKAVLRIGDNQYDGEVIFIDKVVNDKTGSVDAKAVFDNKAQEILPGFFGTIEISGFYQKGGFKIPQVAIKQNATATFVYTLKDDKATVSPIKISYQTGEYAVVSEGINEGDKIIMNNFMRIRPGSPVVEAKAK